MRFFAFWGFIKMNILIVGNGFDLLHYLPTKYDHFMVAMEAIENWDVSKGEMNFDDLFSAFQFCNFKFAKETLSWHWTYQNFLN